MRWILNGNLLYMLINSEKCMFGRKYLKIRIRITRCFIMKRRRFIHNFFLYIFIWILIRPPIIDSPVNISREKYGRKYLNENKNKKFFRQIITRCFIMIKWRLFFDNSLHFETKETDRNQTQTHSNSLQSHNANVRNFKTKKSRINTHHCK